MPVYSVNGTAPTIDPAAYVHPDAVVIGDVHLAADASVWPGAVLRADFGRIEVGARSCIQDGTVIHAGAEWPTIVEEDVVIGHAVHLEGCTIEPFSLVSSGAVVLIGARIGKGALVAAGAVVAPGTDVAPGTTVMGVPARLVDRPPLAPDLLAGGIRKYVDNARAYAATLHRVG